ncbi:CHAP domain-containing protein [Nonomuraea angiospora]|uniref:CHAP domain-containing protein n=1 Tax=Nonomuraea angiospora TaxID=46172 RepID=UPI00341D4FCB
MTPETQRFIELLQRQLGYADKGSSTKAAHKLGYQAWNGQFAWTVAHAKWLKEQHAWGKVPTPGALAFFDWSGSGKVDDIDHVGVVTKVQGDTIFTIEGNTDGGVVERKERNTSSVVGYGYPERVKAHLDATESQPQLVQARPGPGAPQQEADGWSAEARPGSQTQTRQDQYADQTSEASRDAHESQEQPGHRPADSRPDADTTNDQSSDRAPHQPSGDQAGREQPSGDKTVQSTHGQKPQAIDDHATPAGGRPGADEPGRNTADGPGTDAADGSHSQGQSADPVSPGDNQDDPHSATAPEHTQASDSPPNATAPTRDSADIPSATVAPAPSSPDSPGASPTSDTPSITPTPTSDAPTATPTPTVTPTSNTPPATPTPPASETPPTASAPPTSDTPSTTTPATSTASASVPQTAPETTPSPTATTAEPTEPAASPEPEPTASPTEAAAMSQSATPTPTTAPFSAEPLASSAAEPVPEESTPAAPKAADTAVATAFPTHLQASVSGPLPSLSTPALVTSAVVTVVALFAVFVVLKTRAAARSAATAAGYAPPSPPVPVVPRHGAAEPDEGTVWRWELLEAIEAAVLLDTTPPGEQDGAPRAPSQQENRRPGPALGPQEEDALTEPLESIVDTGPIERIVIPPATSPFNAFTPAGPTDENVPDPARNGRSGHGDQHAGDEDVTPTKTPPPPDAL